MGAYLSYGVGFPLILLLSGMPVLVSAEPDLILSMTSLGLGVPALIVMVFATWTTNINNLYSASLSIARILPKARDWMITLISGVIGTLLALAGIMDHFVDFLVLLGIVIPPIAGIYLTDYFLVGQTRIKSEQPNVIPNYRWSAIGTWVIASTFGLLSSVYGLNITGVRAVDTLLIGIGTYWAWSRVVSIAAHRVSSQA